VCLRVCLASWLACVVVCCVLRVHSAVLEEDQRTLEQVHGWALDPVLHRLHCKVSPAEPCGVGEQSCPTQGGA
jgi:hypothetical protein